MNSFPSPLTFTAASKSTPAALSKWLVVLVWLAALGPHLATAQLSDTSYRLVFAEEFNGTSVDTTKWAIASPSWTMPNSLSTATASQVSVGNGLLTLNATRATTAATFTSGSISSYALYTMTSGYVEARIKLPTTLGSWPAFWGLYTGWPPESDIMEYPLTTDGGTNGYLNNAYHTAFHYTNSSNVAASGAGKVTTSVNLGSAYHIFAMDWTAGTSVKYYLDGAQVSSYTGTAVAQMANMYMILDYAVGGWPGTPSTAQWPAGWSDQTLVDWVRVWQRNSNGDTTSNWNVNGGGTFTTTGNWSNSIVPKYGNQTAVFGRVGSATTATITMPTWTVFGGITFDGTTGGTTAYTIGTSANAIQLAGQPLGSTTNGSTVQATSLSTLSQSINAKVELWSATTFRNDMTGGQMLNFNGRLSGNGSLNVTGVGTVVLNGANIHVGGTNIGIGAEAAVLRATANTALGTAVTVIGATGNATTARLELTGAATQVNAIDLRGRTNSSVGIENISGNNTLAGDVSATSGGNVYQIQSDAGTLTLSGAVQAGSGARAFTLQGAGTGVVSGAIQNGGGTTSVVKDGAGTWTLAGANTFTGTTTVSAGTMRLAATTAVASYSFDNVTGSTVTNDGSGGAAMNGTLASGAAIVAGGRFGNAVSLTGGAYVNISSPILDMGSAGSWTVSAWVKTATAGSTILSKGTGTSWATGNTIFYLGDGTAGGSGGIPSGVRYAGGFFQGAANATAVTDNAWHMVTYVNTGGFYAIYVDGVAQPLSGGNSSFGNADIGSVVRLGFTANNNAGDGTINYSGLLDDVKFYGQALSASQIATIFQGQSVAGSLAATANVTIANGGTFDVNGVSQTIGTLSGAGALTKTGAGTLTLNGANTFSGTATVNGGTLNLPGSISGSSAVTIMDGATFTGPGSIAGNLSLTGTAIHAPVGVQSIGSALSYGAGSRLKFTLAANGTATGASNGVAAGGTLTVASGAVLDVTLNGAGSSVDLSTAFWTQTHTWPVVTAANVGGSAFGVGNVSADSGGRLVSDYGILAVQQSATAVALVFTPYTTQQTWQRKYFGADWNNATVAGNLADPDNDGASNLIEWSLGLDPSKHDAVPWKPGTPGLPVEAMITVGGKEYLSLQIRRPIGLTGITYGAKVSGNLADWDDAVQEGTPVANGDGSETAVFRDTVPFSTGGQRFIRLQVTQ